MRIFYCISILLIAATATENAVARTWTIARDVYAVEGELVAVRGETAYLKIGEKVESVPLGRLSAADHQYLASIELAPVTPGPAGENELAEPVTGPLIVGPAGDILPLPGEERSLVVPASGTAPSESDRAAVKAVAEKGLQSPARHPTPRIQGPAAQPWVPSAGTNTPPNTQRPAPENPADRRFWRQQQQQQQQNQQQRNNPNANRNNEDDDESRGLRGRLFERRRGAAAR